MGRRAPARSCGCRADDPGTAHGLAVNVFSLIVGTLQLSRATADPDLSTEVLEKGLECALTLIDEDHQGRLTNPDETTDVHHNKEIR